ncbi:8088_t:CDS:2, partial [Entrophospora sp. SA101]
AISNQKRFIQAYMTQMLCVLALIVYGNTFYGVRIIIGLKISVIDPIVKGMTTLANFGKSEMSNKTKIDKFLSGGPIILNCFIPGEGVKDIFEIKISTSNNNQVSSLGTVIRNARLDKFQDVDPSKIVLRRVEFETDSVIIINLKNKNKAEFGVKMELQDKIFSHFPTQPKPIYPGEKGINVIVYPPTEA